MSETTAYILIIVWLIGWLGTFFWVSARPNSSFRFDFKLLIVLYFLWPMVPSMVKKIRKKHLQGGK